MANEALCEGTSTPLSKMCGTGMRRSRGAGGLSQDLTSGGDGASRASVRLLAKRNVAANSPGGSGRSVPPSASELMDWETDPGETSHGGKPWGAKPRSWGWCRPPVTNLGSETQSGLNSSASDSSDYVC